MNRFFNPSLFRALLFIIFTAITAGPSTLSAELHTPIQHTPIEHTPKPKSHDRSGFRPYEAHYKATSTEVPFKVQANRSMRIQTDTGHIILKSDAKAFMTHIEEISELSDPSCNSRPLNYHYKRKILGNKKQHHLSFDWTQQSVQYHANKEQPEVLSIKPNLLDRLQVIFKLRCAAKAQQKHISLQVISKNQIKTHVYEMQPVTQLTIPYGTVEAIEIKRIRENSERKTSFWVVPKLDYIIAKIHQEKGQEINTFSLKSVNF